MKIITSLLPWRIKALYCIAICVAALHVSTTLAEEYSYDPQADPAVDYQHALEQATAQDKLVLVVFGSQWCPDCRSLNTKMNQEPLQATVQDNFVVTHVDVGNWDKNMDFVAQFGEPVAKGIPSIAIVGSDQKAYYVSEAGEFASARSSSLSALTQWFEQKLTEIQ